MMSYFVEQYDYIFLYVVHKLKFNTSIVNILSKKFNKGET